MTAAANTGSRPAPLAIICGAGSLPFSVADSVLRDGRSVALYGLRGWTDPDRIARYPHEWGSIGQLGRFCHFAQRQGCKDVVMIGGVIRPAVWQLRLDVATILALPRIVAAYRGGDDHLLSGVGRLLEDHGLRMVGAHDVAPDILVPEGPLGRARAADRDRDDIAVGLQFLRATGPFDVGQGVVVGGKHVLAVEAIEGTDLMLARVAELRRIGRLRAAAGTGVLVKAPKPSQDRRFDLPSIGPKTIEATALAGLAGIAIVAGGTVMAEPQRIAELADRAGIFVVGVREDGSA
jgi:DUF1009 family protein